MSKYTANITRNADGRFYALVVRIDRDGEQRVCHGYKGRHFASKQAAKKSTAAYIEKHQLNAQANATRPSYQPNDYVLREMAPLGVVQ